MSQLDFLGLGRPWIGRQSGDSIEHVVLQQPLQRVLAFTGFSIDDVVNNPVARNAVVGYFKLARQIEARCEIVDLEKQWND